MGIGAVLTKSTDRYINQLGIECPHDRLTKSHAINGTRPEVLDQDIGICCEVKKHLLPLVGLQVHPDGALAAVTREKRGRDFVDRRSHMAHLLSCRGLNLDHVGPLISEHHCRDGPGDHTGQIQHFDAL